MASIQHCTRGHQVNKAEKRNIRCIIKEEVKTIKIINRNESTVIHRSQNYVCKKSKSLQLNYKK